MARVGPESRLVARIRDAVRERHPDAWVFKVAGGPYQAAGVPDLLVCAGGRLFAFEVKCPRPGESEAAVLGRVTAIQWDTLGELVRAGAVAEVVTSTDEVISLLDNKG